MDNPGIWLVMWLLIAPIIGVLILSNIGSIEGSKSRHVGRDRTDDRLASDPVRLP